MTIPPGVRAADWAAALKQFGDVVGAQWVFTSDEDVALYRDAYSPFWGEPEERLVSAAVAPDTTEQVSQIVKIANRYRIPLFAISTGKNLGYGGSAGNISGTVIVDLKRMNRVIEVDDERYFAIVEPGVAYFDLYRHIQDRQLKVWIDCPDPGWGSVVGNSLDHGVGYTYGAYRDHFHSHSGLEVVMPNGEIVRTGMGALPGSKTWGEYRYGFGPTIDGLFAQGNVGIVTKMGFHLLPAPEAYQTSAVTVPRRRDLIPLVKIVNELEYAGAIGMPQYGSPLGGFGPPNPALAALLNRPSNPSDEELDQYAAQQSRPYWRCELQWYGPASVIATQMDTRRRGCGRLRVWLSPTARCCSFRSRPSSWTACTKWQSGYRTWRSSPLVPDRRSIRRHLTGTCGFPLSSPRMVRPSSRRNASSWTCSGRWACRR